MILRTEYEVLTARDAVEQHIIKQHHVAPILFVELPCIRDALNELLVLRNWRDTLIDNAPERADGA